MNTICLDVGTTSAKAAAFSNGRRIGEIYRIATPLRLDGNAAELDAASMLQLAMDLIRQAGEPLAGRVDRIAIATMSPAVCLLDERGEPVTPILCHLDRRSEKQALEIARRFGEDTMLQTCGNLPIPGGIACTLLRWLQVHQPQAYRRAARVAPLTTLITSRLTGRYACDPGTGVFLGTYSIEPSHEVASIRPWPAMMEFLQLPESALPELVDGGAIVGNMRDEIARSVDLHTQPQMLAGLMDTSATCLRAGLEPGHLYNVIGTTDVLAICTTRPQPRNGILTRPVGTGPLWFAINTMAAVGAALDWAHRTFFAERSGPEYFELVRKIGATIGTTRRLKVEALDDPLQFKPDLAGSRMQVRQRHGTIQGLRLSTTREQILEALLASLARRSKRRLQVLSKQARPTGRVFLAVGASVAGIQDLWTGRYTLTAMPQDASLQGLAALAATTPG